MNIQVDRCCAGATDEPGPHLNGVRAHEGALDEQRIPPPFAAAKPPTERRQSKTVVLYIPDAQKGRLDLQIAGKVTTVAEVFCCVADGR